MAKNYKKYASGGRFKAGQLSRQGITQLQNQSAIVTNALAEQARQQKQVDTLYIKDLGGKLKTEAQNRADIQALEKDAFNLRMQNEQKRAELEVEALRGKAKKYEQQASMIGQLTPLLAKNLTGLAANIREYADIRYGEAEFQRMKESGELGTLSDFWNATDKLETQVREEKDQQRINNIQTGDRTTFDYLSGVERNTSKHLQRKIYRYLQQNFDTYIQDFENFVRDKVGMDVNANVRDLYSYRAHEFLRQYGISRKSPTGIKIIELFDAKAATREYQFKLQRDKLHGEKDQRDNTENLRSALSQSLGPNYTEFDRYNEAQSFVKSIVIDGLGTPTITRSGTLQPSTSINPLPVFVEWAKGQAQSPRYKDNPDLFKREVLGITEFQNGYILPTSRGNEKPIPIFDKLEYLEAEIMGGYGQITSDLRKADTQVLKAKEAGEISKAVENIRSNKYQEDYNQVFDDIKATRSDGAKKIYYDYLNFHSADGVSQNTINHVLHAAQQGDFSQFIFRYDKLTKEEKEGGVLTPFKETMDALEQVAGSYDAIETKIKEDVKSKITAAVKENMIDQTRHDTATQASEAAQLWFYNKYRANSKIEDPNERYITTLEQLEDQLGLGDTPGQDGVVGKGLFKNRPGTTGENKTVFIMFSDADARGDTIGQSIIDSEVQKGTTVPALLARKDLVSNGETRLLAEAALRGTDNIVLPKNLKYVLNNYYPKGTNAHHIVNQYLGLQGYKINMPASAHDFAEYVSGGSVKYENMAAALIKEYIENSGYSRQPVPKPAWMTLANPIYQDLLRRQYPEYYNE